MRIGLFGIIVWRLIATLAGALLVVAAIVLASSDARSQSASRGQQLYVQIGCSNAGCHGANPAANANQILNGAGSAAAIEYAMLTRSDHDSVRVAFDIDPNASADLAAWLATIRPEPPAPPTAAVIEFHHAAFSHYFATSIASEIAALDGGQIAGWTRTGRSFNAYVSDDGSAVPVCRFFTEAFAPKSSHFYTPVASECTALRGGSDVWRFEGEALWVRAADPSGACPSGTLPVYRLYNNGQSGAPNHRYTADLAVRSDMLANGWIAEGHGPLGVIFCAPT